MGWRGTCGPRTDELLGVLDLIGGPAPWSPTTPPGMTKKVSLAGALIHAPRLLVLDEPFEAVDPVSGYAIRTILRHFVASGGTVVMSSHVMALVEGLCDRVAVRRGRVLAAGRTTAIRGGGTLHARFLELVGARDVADDGLSWLG